MFRDCDRVIAYTFLLGRDRCLDLERDLDRDLYLYCGLGVGGLFDLDRDCDRLLTGRDLDLLD